MLKPFKRKLAQKLILNFQSGDLESFSKVYAKFYRPVLRYTLKHIPSANVAEEITQDIFLKIYQFRQSYKPELSLSTWIWTVAKNTVYDHLRQVRSIQNTCKFQQSMDTPEFELAIQETAESILIEGAEKERLVSLMASLSGKQKEAIFLRLVKRFSYQEISKTMNLSLSAVKSLINRGKTSLLKAASPLYSRN